MLKNCMKFYQDKFIQQSFLTATAIYKVQRGITKIHNQELWFLHSARRRTEINICISFMKMKGFKVIQPT